MEKIKILFLAANPAFTPKLKLDEEIRAITENIRKAEYRDSIKMESSWAVRPDDLMQTLLEHRPHIVHFSGHGDAKGEIILLDKDGNPQPIRPEAIHSLFNILKDNINIVVFNACYSEIQAEAVTGVIDIAVGMNDAISDEAAITFAASFYRGLGFGRSVKEAFELGRTAIMMLPGIPEENIPELLVKNGVDPSCIFLIDREVGGEKAGKITDEQNETSGNSSQNNNSTGTVSETSSESEITKKKLNRLFGGTKNIMEKEEKNGTKNRISVNVKKIGGDAEVARIKEINVEPGENKNPGKGTNINFKAKEIKGSFSVADILREKSEG